jgi:hypothetical protein
LGPVDHDSEQTVSSAVAAFLARADLAAQSRRSYAQTLNRIAGAAGGDLPLVALDADAIGVVLLGAWGDSAPATWNRHLATARSFVAFCQRHTGWPLTSWSASIDAASRPTGPARSVRAARATVAPR